MAPAPLKNRMYQAMPRVQKRPQQTFSPQPQQDQYSAEPGQLANQFSSMRDAQMGGDRLGAFTRFKGAPDDGMDDGAPQEAGYRRMLPGENVDLTNGAAPQGQPTAMARGGIQPQPTARAQGGIQPQGGFQRVSPGLYRSSDGKIVRESQMRQMQKAPTATAQSVNKPKIGQMNPNQAVATGPITPSPIPGMATARTQPKPKPKQRQIFKAK